MDTHNAGQAGVRTIKASEFKARCLKLMDEIADSGAEIVITKNGRPVSRLVPFRKKPKSLFGIDRGRLEILGDVDEPLDVAWEAATGRIWEDDHCSS
jgi:prevent-host-death family protein